ncbi:MAG: TonB-dependent receptor [Sphingomonas taxi]|uniref:TonB-dependent receptor n=1 Tax=Sphingomonas taxi TaxID=1549858 RepID=A0A2W5AVK6_9SPHN|nr:MAG: TonB-dependent receptor [Sphingomonas taxi]
MRVAKRPHGGSQGNANVVRTSNFMRKALSGSSALQALALMGAGVGLAATVVPASAQDYSQVSATGRVRGTNGEPIAGASVAVTSNDQGFTRTVTTNSDGTYRVTALPQGNYTFTISAAGFDTFTDNAVVLSQGSAANQFTLAATGATASDEIVVTAGRIRTVDFDRNTTGTVLNVADTAARVPVARDITSVILLTPGAVSGDNRFGSLPAINGASVSENVYYVNGLNITQFRNGLGAVPIPFDFYQTVETKTGGISAEFGRFTGGMFNATTKSGSNEFHGGVTFNWAPDDLRSDTRNTYAADNDASFSDRKEFIAQLSGPIIKDHLFFYGLYNSRSVTNKSGATGTVSATGTGINGCATNPTFCGTSEDLASFNQAIVGTSYLIDRNSSPFYGGKIDAVIVDGQRLEATYFNTSATTVRDIFGTSTYSLASGQRYNLNTNEAGGYVSSTVLRSGGENYVGRYTGTFTDWLTLSAAYGVNKNRETTESSTPELASVNDLRNGGNASIGNVTGNNNVAFDKRTFYRADADLNFRLLGSHHIRFGYDREDLNLRNFITANGGFQYELNTAAGTAATIDPVVGLPGGTQYVKARTFVSGGEFDSRNVAFYAQDSWQLFGDRLQLNLGIRNDKFENKNAAGVTFYKAKDQWSPRLGFSADPMGDGLTKVYGSFSRYYLPVAANTNVRLAGSELDYDTYYRLSGLGPNNIPVLGGAITGGSGLEPCPGGTPAGTACVVRNDGSVPDTASVVASNLKPQSLDEIVLGFERRVGSRIKFGAYYTQTDLNDSLEDAALDQAIIPYCVSQGKTAASCRAIWNGVHQYALINPGRDVSVTLSDPLPGETALRTVTLSGAALGYPQAERKYRSMTFTFDREFDGKWDLHANYTYAKLVGNIEGGIRSDNAQTDAGLTTAFDLPALVNGTYGYLPNDRRHNFKAYGSYRFADWLTLGANGVLASPRRYGCFGRAPANADFDSVAVGGLAGRFYGAAAAYCNVSGGDIIRDPNFAVVNDSFNRVGGVRPSTLQVVKRATALKSDWLAQLDLDAQIQLPTEGYSAFLRLSVFNVFNSKQELRYSEIGTTSAGAPLPTYSLPTQYNPGRSARIQLGVNF